jgi:hypothetical protein
MSRQIIEQGGVAIIADDTMARDEVQFRSGSHWLRYRVAGVSGLQLEGESFDAGRNWRRPRPADEDGGGP